MKRTKILKSAFTSGFTLVELLVVIALAGTMVFLTAGWFSNVKDRANNTTCTANMRTILSGVICFATDRDGKLWSRSEVGYSKYRMVDDPLGLPMLLQDYVPNKKVWLCPSGRKSLKKFGNNYTWNATVAFEEDNINIFKTPHKSLVLWDTYAYSLPSMFNASDDFRGDGTSPTGPSALNSKFHLRPHGRQSMVNWGFADGHVITGVTAAQ